MCIHYKIITSQISDIMIYKIDPREKCRVLPGNYKVECGIPPSDLKTFASEI